MNNDMKFAVLIHYSGSCCKIKDARVLVANGIKVISKKLFNGLS